VVVGFGSCGIELLNHANLLKNKKVAIIEEKNEGGTCLNTGCIPSKYWLRASHLYKSLPSYKKFGINVEGKISFEEIKSNMLKFVANIRQNLIHKAQSLGIEIIKGGALLLNEHTLQVNDKTITFEKLIIASGSRPIELPHLKFNEKILSTDTFWKSINQNDKIIIVGAGIIGIEVSFMLQPFKIVKSMVDLAPDILSTFHLPEEVKHILKQKIKEMGIKIELATSVKSFANDKVELTNGQIYDNISKVLVAVGRKPNTSWLNNIVKLNDKGYVETNELYQTSSKHIYACGDVVGSNLAHAAMYQMQFILKHMFSLQTSALPLCYPPIIYSDPQIAWCGTFTSEVRTIKFSHNPTSYLYNVGEECFANLYLEEGKVKGILIVHPYASELIHIFLPFINKQLKWENEYFAHPSMSFSFRGFNR